jgi:3-hydroxyisobutyrate dehydrogenase-like beta-hydroxyacid dehydrogenase
MSTAPPRLMQELYRRFRAKDDDFADAPVARTRRAAVDGTLSIMVGGSEAVFARLKPILATMGTEPTLCGGVCAGQVENYHDHRRSPFRSPRLQAWASGSL